MEWDLNMHASRLLLCGDRLHMNSHNSCGRAIETDRHEEACWSYKRGHYTRGSFLHSGSKAYQSNAPPTSTDSRHRNGVEISV